jgi:hypothetical protein
MVTATTGTLTLKNLGSGKTQSYSIYISDVNAASVLFSTFGVAGTGSANFVNAPFDAVIWDISVITGPTVITQLNAFKNDVPRAQPILLANVINNLQSRCIPQIGFRAGDKISITQA